MVTAVATPLLYEAQRSKYIVFISNLVVFIGIKLYYLWHPGGLGATPFPFYFAYLNDVVISLLLFLIVENAFSNNNNYQSLFGAAKRTYSITE